MSRYTLLEDSIIEQELRNHLDESRVEIELRISKLREGEHSKHKNQWKELAAFYRAEAEYILTMIGEP